MSRLHPTCDFDRFSYLKTFLLLAYIFLLLTGCQTKLEDKDIRWVPGLDGKKLDNIGHVNGIRQALSESKTPVRVFMVHGMITKDPNYSVAFQASIGKKLELVRVRQYPVMPLERGYQLAVMSGPQPFEAKAPMSEIRKTSWVDSSNKERLVFYELLWAPLRDEMKRQFIACYESRLTEGCNNVTKVNRAKDSRMIINGWIKDDIMVNGFADAMLVLSPLGDVIRDDVNQAMCIIASDVLIHAGFQKSAKSGRCDLLGLAKSQESRQRAGMILGDTKFITVTHSLGSFLVLDTQQRYARSNLQSPHPSNIEIANEQRDEFLFSLTDQSTVFMMANQIGLLQLVRLETVCWAKDNEELCPNRLVPTVNKGLTVEARGQLRRFVAFNDSDDLLGFELQPYLSSASVYGPLVNVSVRNSGFSIPWLFKNPKGAHTNHFENEIIINAVTDGFELK